VRWSAAERLTAAGYDVLEAGLASEAIERFLSTDVDLVLLDLELPDADAASVISRIKALAPLTQIVVTTVAATIPRAVDVVKLGAFDYVQKPFNPDELEFRVKRALELLDLRREVEMLRKTSAS
jgi:DNA-binding NtrC family response regulator